MKHKSYLQQRKWFVKTFTAILSVSNHEYVFSFKLTFKVPMKRIFLFFHMKEHKKLQRLPFNPSLISYLVSELQSFEDT